MKKITKKNNQPLISVIMPVYNAGDFLVEAIESILNQTYQNFEFIIIDDNSSDDSWQILKKYKKIDQRVKIYKNKNHLGVSNTMKKAIKKAKGTFLARMDADDVSSPQRLEKQLIFLIKNPKNVACGTQCYIVNKNSKIIGEKKFPISFEEIYKYIFIFAPLQQPTLMINRKLLPKDFTYYQDGMNTAEEIELIFKLFQFGKITNLKEKLLYYRLHDKNTSLVDPKKTFLLTLYSRIKAVLFYHYRPTIKGLIYNIIQTFAILFLPKKFIVDLYQIVRKLKYKKTSFKSDYRRTLKLGFLGKLNN